MASAITGEELGERIGALRTQLQHNDYDGALVWGRGGGAVDRYADVRYLTGFYPAFPTIRDVPDVWSDRGFCALLVTQSEVVLFSDDEAASMASWGLTAAIVRHGVGSRSLVGDVGEYLADRPELRTIVNVGTDAMSGKHAKAMASIGAFAARAVVDDDLLVERLRLRKSAGEIAWMREAAKIAGAALEAGFAALRPGARESDVVAAMAAVVASRRAVLANAFVYVTRADGSAGEERLPTWGDQPLAEGDLFTVDLSGACNGYFFDVARSAVVGGDPTPEQEAPYRLAVDTVDAVVARLVPGSVLGEAAREGSELLRAAGIDPEEAEFAARGHGLGLGFESPWVRDDSDLILEPGMVISVEQFCTLGGWSATYERNILITADGPEDLFPIRDFWGLA